MDLKNINFDKVKKSFKTTGDKLLTYRFYLISLAVLVLLSVVILDVSVVTDIEADPSKIEGEQTTTTRQLDHSIIDQIDERLDQSSQSANNIPGRNPFDINN